MRETKEFIKYRIKMIRRIKITTTFIALMSIFVELP